MTAVEIRNAGFTYRGSSTPAVHDLDLTIEEGEFLLLAGPTGSGKSTLLRLMNGLVPHLHEGVFTGHVRVFGRDTLKERPAVLARFVGTVFQTPEEQIVASRVWRDVAFGLENLLLSRDLIEERVREALAYVGLDGMRDREVFGLSGGEKQRLALASVLAMRPRLLLLDEPAAELDPRGRAAILQLLAGLPRDVTVVLADHRLNDVAPLADRLVLLREGGIAFDGPPREVLTRSDVADLGVEVPTAVEVWKRLASLGFQLDKVPLTLEEVVGSLMRIEEVAHDHS